MNAVLEFPPPPGGEAWTTEVVTDELKVSMANRFAKGESTAC
jgi:hypothetical protein